MSNLFSVLVKTVVLDDAAYREWRDRSNLFLRGVILIVVVSLVAGLVTFATDLANRIRPVNAARIEEEIKGSFDESYRWNRWNPNWQGMDPEVQEIVDEQMDAIVEMIVDIARVKAPLPRVVSGSLEAVGAFFSRAPSALAGWLFYGALVLIAVNLLGGSAKLPDFLAMVSLYATPGLLGLLGGILCLGPLLGLAGLVWSVAIYVKAVSVVSDLDIGRSLVAVLAPAILLILLGILVAILAFIWLVVVF